MPGPSDEYEAYLAYRRYLLEAHQESARSFDRTVVALSAGALGLSLAFIDRLPEKEFFRWALGVGWTAFGLSLLAHLMSVYWAERDYFDSLAAVDRAYEADKFPLEIELTRFEKRVPRANGAALGFFILGVAALIIFTYGTLRGES